MTPLFKCCVLALLALVLMLPGFVTLFNLYWSVFYEQAIHPMAVLPSYSLGAGFFFVVGFFLFIYAHSMWEEWGEFSEGGTD